MTNDQIVKSMLRKELGPHFGDVLFAVNCVFTTTQAMQRSDYPYYVRFVTSPIKDGEPYRKVDVRIFDLTGSKHEWVASTGKMNEIAACTAAVSLLRQLLAERQAEDAAWAERYSDKGSYADKLRRKFL